VYGPPPDERQVLAPVQLVDDPISYLICIGVGIVVSSAFFWKRPPQAFRYFFLILGQTIVLTAPLAVHLDTYVYGSFPTIDKEGSLLFYLDGVHERMIFHPFLSPTDPSARLIGVHIGHLWVTAFFDLFLTPFGAMNAQGLLYPALGWWTMWLLLREVCRDARIAFLLGFPFGMGLHVFRDLNWYTIEKSAIFWIPLFSWSLLKAWRDGGKWRKAPAAIFLTMTWMNLYLGMVSAVLGACALFSMALVVIRNRAVHVEFRRVLHACTLCSLWVLPLIIWQWALMKGGPEIGTPEQFLWERAALDGFSLVPFQWNRLEIHRALNLVGVGLAIFGVFRCWKDPRVRFATFTGLILAIISIGPILLPGPILNPFYLLIRDVVPGFWRVAKPEVFFHGTWMLMLVIASIELKRMATRGWWMLYVIFIIGWLFMVRTHPAYPPMTLPQNSHLSPTWADDVFGEPDLPSE